MRAFFDSAGRAQESFGLKSTKKIPENLPELERLKKRPNAQW